MATAVGIGKKDINENEIKLIMNIIYFADGQLTSSSVQKIPD